MRSILISLLLLLIILATAGHFTFKHYTQNVQFNSDTKLIDIEKGQSVKSISTTLYKNKVIINDRLFTFYVVLNKLENSLKAGEYEFDKNITIKYVADKLASGDVKQRRITIPEGLTTKQIAQIFEINQLFSAQQFLEILSDRDMRLELLGDAEISFEGYLFPETYSYSKDVSPEEFVRMMLKMYKKVYAGLKTEFGPIDGFSDYDILKLASIIEKESGANSELGLISSVFHNRLRIGMKLDSDPTIIYGMGDSYKGNIRKKDIEEYTEYNTYHIQGLPPTPISNPGMASLRAALNPEESEYLYFVAMGDGTHYFSKNYSEHQRAVYKYQTKKRNN